MVHFILGKVGDIMEVKRQRRGDHINITLPSEIYSALMIASVEKDTSISKVIEEILTGSEEFRKFIDRAKEYAELESKLNPTAVSSRSINKEDKDKLRK